MRSIRLKKQQQLFILQCLFEQISFGFDKTHFIVLLLQEYKGISKHFNWCEKQKQSTSEKQNNPEQKETMTRKEKLVRLHLLPEQQNSKYEHFHKYTCLYTMIFFIKWLSSLPTANLRLIVAIMQVLSEASSWIFIFTHAVCNCDQPASYKRLSILHPP